MIIVTVSAQFATENLERAVTWRQMQRRMRMIRAIELLSDADGSVVSIALDVGY